jgi:hypothetical protein
MPLSPEQLGRIDDTQMVEIETRRGERVTRTIIWVMVDDGEVFVRSVRGPAGRWYQRALADPDVALIVGADRYPFRAALANDTESVERASNALRRKYRPGRSLDSMLAASVLETTLRLEPVD